MCMCSSGFRLCGGFTVNKAPRFKVSQSGDSALILRRVLNFRFSSSKGGNVVPLVLAPVG